MLPLSNPVPSADCPPNSRGLVHIHVQSPNSAPLRTLRCAALSSLHAINRPQHRAALSHRSVLVRGRLEADAVKTQRSSSKQKVPGCLSRRIQTARYSSGAACSSTVKVKHTHTHRHVQALPAQSCVQSDVSTSALSTPCSM
jgi:hypothetical protein